MSRQNSAFRQPEKTDGRKAEQCFATGQTASLNSPAAKFKVLYVSAEKTPHQYPYILNGFKKYC
ncbi:hypothetical protein OP500_07940 [Kingella sp. SNUBH-2017]|uniref:hypothetical protein n=1 Tax=Kingella sp. SNUBH-2017 TaxID=2994077 RepID=UPI0023636E74|nr:hypothetical protein [Kingella sp. SNUBH-2017]MDD2183236.1 hypothetical protein [Kingella sp. SNUBH-2017]